MNIYLSVVDGVSLVRLSGVVDQTAAGRLHDTLVNLIGTGQRRVIIELSQVDLLTRAATRSLVVAAKLLQPPKGALRICGAHSTLGAMLDGLGHDYLLKRDPDLATSFSLLRSAGDQPPLPDRVSTIATPTPANANAAGPDTAEAGATLVAAGAR